MGFVNYNHVKNLLPSAVQKLLLDPATFTQVEAEAAKKISEITGHPIPTEPIGDWAILPSARIMRKLVNGQVSGASPEYYAETEADYERALADLERHKVKDPVEPKNKNVTYGKIEGELSW